MKTNTSFFMKGGNAGYVLSFITFFTLFSASYLISGKTYQKFIQYQYDFFEDHTEARETIKKELKAAEKRINANTKWLNIPIFFLAGGVNKSYL